MTTDDQCRSGFFQALDIDYLIHELKDPIAVIETGARMLLERQDQRGRLTPVQERTMQRVLRNTIKAREMLYGLLEVGRAEAGCQEPESFVPATLLPELIVDSLAVRGDRIMIDGPAGQGDSEEAHTPDLVMAAHDVDLKIFDSAQALSVMLDRVKFEHIIRNLTCNGLDYRKRLLRVTLDVADPWMIVTVFDDGPGIPANLHEAVFQRYTRLKTSEPLGRQGHGLGLAGSRILARAMGGDIQLVSESGRGTAFSARLPVAS